MKTTIFDLGNNVLFVHSKSLTDVVHLGLMVDVGSRYDSIELSGMSHFIEHMWFKGTARRISTKIVEDIERFGGDFNAYTSKEETCVYVSILKDYSDVAFDVLSDIYVGSLFPEDELVKEREVIFDEIDSYEDSPSELIYDEFEGKFFDKSNLSLSVLGTKKSLMGIDSLVMKQYYQEYFLSAKIVISFVGNLSFDVVLSKIKDSFDLTKRKTSHHLIDKSMLLGSKFNLSKKKKTSQAHYLLGCDAYCWSDSRRLTLSVLNNILGGPQMSSLLNVLLREQNGLTYTVESNFTSFSNAGLFCIYFGTDKTKVEKCLALIDSEFKRVCTTTMIVDKLKDFKNQMLGQLAMSYDNNQNIMLSQAKGLMVFDKVDSFSVLASKINAISEKQVLDVANDVLCFDKMSFLKYY